MFTQRAILVALKPAILLAPCLYNATFVVFSLRLSCSGNISLFTVSDTGVIEVRAQVACSGRPPRVFNGVNANTLDTLIASLTLNLTINI